MRARPPPQRTRCLHRLRRDSQKAHLLSRQYLRSPTKSTQSKLAFDNFYPQGATQQLSSVLAHSSAGLPDGGSSSNNLPPSIRSRQSTKWVSSPDPIARRTRSKSSSKDTQPELDPDGLPQASVSQPKASIAGFPLANQLSKHEPSLSSKSDAMSTSSPVIAPGSLAPDKDSESSKDVWAPLESHMSSQPSGGSMKTKQLKSPSLPTTLRRPSRTADSSNVPHGTGSGVAGSVTGSPRWQSPSTLPAAPSLDQNQSPADGQHDARELNGPQGSFNTSSFTTKYAAFSFEKIDEENGATNSLVKISENPEKGSDTCPRLDKASVIESARLLAQNQPRCRYCFMYFMSDEAVTKHEKNKHPKGRTATCNWNNSGCDKRIHDPRILQSHIKFEHKYAPISGGCSKLWRGARIEGSVLQRCNVCGDDFLSFATHQTCGKYHQCPVCNLRFNRKSAMEIHRKCHSSDREMFRCTWKGCGKSLTSERSLQKHIRASHKGEKLICLHCRKEYSYNSREVFAIHVMKHLGTLEERRYKCNREGCTAEYVSSSGLRSHILCYHMQIRFECDIDGCGARFNSATAWNGHCQRKHQGVEIADHIHARQRASNQRVEAARREKATKGLCCASLPCPQKAMLDGGRIIPACEEHRTRYLHLKARQGRLRSALSSPASNRTGWGADVGNSNEMVACLSVVPARLLLWNWPAVSNG